MNTAEERIALLPEQIQKHVAEGDPSWSYCPDGWRDLVVKMNEHLEKIDPDYVLNQCKEKFGGLRYYTNRPFDPDDLFFIVVNYYENQSFHVCDVCGERGECGPTENYIATRCDAHDGGLREKSIQGNKLYEKD